MSTRVLCAAATLLLAIACNQMMGIEEAHVDASLARGESSAGAGGAGGSSSLTSSDTESAVTATSAGGSSSTPDNTKGPQGGAGDSGNNENSANTTAANANSSGGSSPNAASTTEGSVPATLCESYCDEIMEVCTGPLLQYRDHAQCLTVCNHLPEGVLGETNKNTVACRAKYTGDARYGSGTELEAYCRQAGPAGSGRCGSNCQGLCSIMMKVCTPQNAGVYSFENMEECVEVCDTLPQLESGYSAADPTIADGNHVQCRLFHVMSAAMLDAEEHCEHAMGITLCEVPAEP